MPGLSNSNRRVGEFQLEFYHATLWPFNFCIASASAG